MTNEAAALCSDSINYVYLSHSSTTCRITISMCFFIHSHPHALSLCLPPPSSPVTYNLLRRLLLFTHTHTHTTHVFPRQAESGQFASLSSLSPVATRAAFSTGVAPRCSQCH
jgi:hypothetical protein